MATNKPINFTRLVMFKSIFEDIEKNLQNYNHPQYLNGLHWVVVKQPVSFGKRFLKGLAKICSATFITLNIWTPFT